MTATEKREYSGAALSSLIVALSEHQAIVDKLLADAGVSKIDPEAWYDYEWAFDLFDRFEHELGRAAIIKVGRSMIEAAIYPPEIDNVEKMLSGVGEFWRLNARGLDIGALTCEWEDGHTAIIESTIHRSHCTMLFGIIEGACTRFGITPLVEHGPGSCIQHKTGPKCLYRVTW